MTLMLKMPQGVIDACCQTLSRALLLALLAGLLTARATATTAVQVSL
jgi:hypothetical protein